MKKAKITRLGRYDSFISWEMQHYPARRRNNPVGDPWVEEQELVVRGCVVMDGHAAQFSRFVQSDKEKKELQKELQRVIECYQEMLEQVDSIWEPPEEDRIEQFKRENL